jgi:integrase/recombinase XerC
MQPTPSALKKPRTMITTYDNTDDGGHDNARGNAQCIALPSTDRLAPSSADPIKELVADFFGGRTATTLKTYRQALRDFARYLGVERIDQAAGNLLARGPGPANQLVLRYRTHMVDHGLSPATVNLRLSAVRSLVRLARTVGLVAWSLEVRNVRAENCRDCRGPGTNAVRQMLDRAGNHRSPGNAARNRALVRMLHDLGLRRGEVVSIDLENLDLQSGRIQVRLKGYSQRTSRSLPQQTCDAIEAWLRHRGNDPGPLFTNFDRAGKGRRLTGRSIGRIIQQLGADVGVVARPHGIRHSSITLALTLTNGDVRRVRQFSSHADVRTVLRYDDARMDAAGEIARQVAAAL